MAKKKKSIKIEFEELNMEVHFKGVDKMPLHKIMIMMTQASLMLQAKYVVEVEGLEKID